MTFTYTRWPIVLGGLGAACALVVATQILPWWSFSEAVVYLTRAERCFGGECQATGMRWLGASAWWHRLAAAAFGAGLFTALLALFVAGARAAGRIPRLAAASLLVGVLTSLACGIGAWVSFPRLGPSQFAAGPLVFVLGLGACAAIAIAVRRLDVPARS